MLLSVTADTWIVTGLGFGIVLGLLFCLVFILMLFGWIMQRVAKEKPAAQANANANANANAEADAAAIAMALFLAEKAKASGPFAQQSRETAWNFKSMGFNNTGF